MQTRATVPWGISCMNYDPAAYYCSPSFLGGGGGGENSFDAHKAGLKSESTKKKKRREETKKYRLDRGINDSFSSLAW